MDSFKLATFNVHCWGDADCEDNVDRVAELVKVKRDQKKQLVHFM